MKLIGSLRHKVEVRGDILSTGMKWGADAEKPGGEASFDTVPSRPARNEGLPKKTPSS